MFPLRDFALCALGFDWGVRKAPAVKQARGESSDTIGRCPVLISTRFLACNAIAPLARITPISPGHHVEEGLDL